MKNDFARDEAGSFFMEKLSDHQGFTLIELMMVVAIIGILAAIVTQEYSKLMAKARQSEAKISLGNIYTAEVSFAAEQNSFTQCLEDAGYSPENALRYYLTGFWGVPTPTCGPSGNAMCNATSWPGGVALLCDVSDITFDAINKDHATFGANQTVSSGVIRAPYSTLQGDSLGIPNSWNAFKNSFIAGAFGNVSKQPIYDIWQIDEKKQLVNTQLGL